MPTGMDTDPQPSRELKARAAGLSLDPRQIHVARHVERAAVIAPGAIGDRLAS